jgi:flavodoxin I
MDVKLFFGSTTGNTEKAAKAIASELAGIVSEVVDIRKASADDFEFADAFIFGLSTVAEGDMQEDWDAFMDQFEDVDLDGKKVALFGLGDQVGYPAYFVTGMGKLCKKCRAKGAVIVGAWPTDGYEFEHSEALEGGKFCGLVLDDDNQADLTEGRIKTWCAQIRGEFS